MKTIKDVSFQMTVTGQMISNQLEKAGLSGEGTEHIREAIILGSNNKALANVWNALMGVDITPVVKVDDEVEVEMFNNKTYIGKVIEINKYETSSVKVEYIKDGESVTQWFTPDSVKKINQETGQSVQVTEVEATPSSNGGEPKLKKPYQDFDPR